MDTSIMRGPAAARTRIVVIGGGYAGVIAANRIMKSPSVAVTVVNPNPRFVERIRLHQLVGGSHAAVAEFSHVLHRGIELKVDAVTRIDASARQVELASGGSLAYDYLICAFGSGGWDPQVEGAAEHAHSVADHASALRLRDALASAPLDAPVVIVGGGATGIEVAGELAELGRRVTLVCRSHLNPYLHESGRRRVRRELDRLGVEVLEGTAAAEVRADGVVLADGRVLPSAVTIWTAGFTVPDLAARSGLTVDAKGRLVTDETLTSVDDGRILATGDAAAPSNLPLRMSCQAAMPLGVTAGETVLARLAGRAPAPFDGGCFAQCISVGRSGATLQISRAGDVATRFAIGGRAAVPLKETACKVSLPGLVWEARRPGAMIGLKDRTRARRVAERIREGVPA